MYSAQFEERLDVEKQKLKAEIEQALRSDYENMISQKIEALKSSDSDYLTEIRKDLEQQFQSRLKNEKNA